MPIYLTALVFQLFRSALTPGKMVSRACRRKPSSKPAGLLRRESSIRRWISRCMLIALCFLPGCSQYHKSVVSRVKYSLPAPQPFRDISPCWSHNEKEIAFLRAYADGTYQLGIASANLKSVRLLFKPEVVNPDRPIRSSLETYCSPERLCWSPDDSHIAFERTQWYKMPDDEKLPGTSLWQINVVTENITPLALHKVGYKGPFYYLHSPVWSPDGRYLAFIGEGIDGQKVLYIHPMMGQPPRKVTARFDNYEQTDWPAWSPVVRLQPIVAFSQGIVRSYAAPDTATIRRLQPGGMMPNSAREIVRIRSEDYLKTGAPVTLKGTPALRITGITWSQDGRKLAYSLTPDGMDYDDYSLWMVNSNGFDNHRVTVKSGSGYFAPVWIGENALGALSINHNKLKAVIIDCNSNNLLWSYNLNSADCDWSPDRSKIVCARRSSKLSSSWMETNLYLITTDIKKPINPL